MSDVQSKKARKKTPLEKNLSAAFRQRTMTGCQTVLKIGEKKDGKGFPVALDYFTAYTNIKQKGKNLIAGEIQEQLENSVEGTTTTLPGGKEVAGVKRVRSVNIMFPSDEIDELWSVSYRMTRFSDDKFVSCVGDGETARVTGYTNPHEMLRYGEWLQNNPGGDYSSVKPDWNAPVTGCAEKCLGQECKFYAEGWNKKNPNNPDKPTPVAQCKMKGALRFMLTDAGELGTFTNFYTQSWNSIFNIHNKLEKYKAMFGGKLAFIPFKLRIIKVTGKFGPVPAVDIVVNREALENAILEGYSEEEKPKHIHAGRLLTHGVEAFRSRMFGHNITLGEDIVDFGAELLDSNDFESEVFIDSAPTTQILGPGHLDDPIEKFKKETEEASQKLTEEQAAPSLQGKADQLPIKKRSTRGRKKKEVAKVEPVEMEETLPF